MDLPDSEAKRLGNSWIRGMFIFSVILILIGLELSAREDRCANSYFYCVDWAHFLGPIVLFVGVSFFVQTGIIISFRFLKSLLMKRS